MDCDFAKLPKICGILPINVYLTYIIDKIEHKSEKKGVVERKYELYVCTEFN